MKPTQAFDDILRALADEDDELDGLLAGLDDAGWARPSRCPGWSVADVVLHLAQTDEMGQASAEQRFTDAATEFGNPPGAAPDATVDDLAGLAVDAERGRPPGEILERWRQARTAQAKALAACEPGTRLPWVSGRLAAITLATTRLAEHWIHAGDVAEALGRPPVATDRLRPIARLAWRTLPYAFSRAGRPLSGPVAVILTGPGDEPWELLPDEPAATTVTGPALDFCLVAARRLDPADSALEATGADATAVLELVRTFA
jgi:uncharacterized protein (TIGR03084 family)